MVDIIKQYNNLRYTIEQSRWGMTLNKVNKISYKDCELQIVTCKTAKKLVFKHCSQYYKYKELFCDYLEVNPFTLIESQQPTRCDGSIINDIEWEGYDKDFQKRESPSPDFEGLML